MFLTKLKRAVSPRLRLRGTQPLHLYRGLERRRVSRGKSNFFSWYNKSAGQSLVSGENILADSGGRAGGGVKKPWGRQGCGHKKRGRGCPLPHVNHPSTGEKPLPHCLVRERCPLTIYRACLYSYALTRFITTRSVSSTMATSRTPLFSLMSYTIPTCLPTGTKSHSWASRTGTIS